ncbi:MAG: hypothetical protein J5647_14230, partial [Spirochaetaceae bacterium]|nr:hypothetical protein [Spirochaetaceae bacterium]
MCFGQDNNSKQKWNVEIVDLDHPIFDWIKWVVKEKPIRASGCSAISIKSDENIKKGNYVYYIQKWTKKGIEKSSELKYFIGCVDDGRILPSELSERILNSVITDPNSHSLADPIVRLNDFEPYYNSVSKIVNHAWD